MIPTEGETVEHQTAFSQTVDLYVYMGVLYVYMDDVYVYMGVLCVCMGAPQCHEDYDVQGHVLVLEAPIPP